MNNEIQNILDNIINLLEEEKKLLIISLKDSKFSEDLKNIISKKQENLSKLASFEEKDILNFEKELKKIKMLNKENMNLAENNLKFIEDVFEAIFEKEETKQYTQNGEIKSKKEGLFNKKV
ncbi:hypothetical protein [Nitrosophilus kaiyonis]|uniref:hypothetical protein n=1 Tax=Nitrosophilus kaiyonis TaxID=2930200 RepID=UPI002490556F|nr:hypothetical protein [Nitrosophilus kaiyonis]